MTAESLQHPVRAVGDPEFRDAQLRIFAASALKQQKWRALRLAAGAISANTAALDLGSDNGTISWLFRSLGGTWSSADLGEETTTMIRRMVGERVFELDDARLPFENTSFDLIVVVDLLEHVENDREMLQEIARCLKPGGRAVLNLPHRKPRSQLRALRHRVGLTDEWHGHLRAGYTAEELPDIMPGTLRVASVRSYSRFFSHFLDTALSWVFLRSAGSRARRTPKGMVVSGTDVRGASGGAFRLLGPAMRGFVALDALLPWTNGYMLMVVAERVGPA